MSTSQENEPWNLQVVIQTLYLFYVNKSAPRSCLHLASESFHPQAGAGLTPCTLGLQRSLWEDVDSVPSLLQKRVTRDLLDPWSRAWSTGSVREAEVKSCGAGAETSARTEVGSPEHRRQSSPLGCGVRMGLSGWGRMLLSALDTYVVTLRRWF